MGTATINVAIEIEGDAADRVFDLVNGMPEIFQAVIVERHAQDRQWGGPEHDDKHIPQDWEGLIGMHAALLTDVDGNGLPRADYRQRLITVAALAVAATQSWDRTRPATQAEG